MWFGVFIVTHCNKSVLNLYKPLMLRRKTKVVFIEDFMIRYFQFLIMKKAILEYLIPVS